MESKNIKTNLIKKYSILFLLILTIIILINSIAVSFESIESKKDLKKIDKNVKIEIESPDNPITSNDNEKKELITYPNNNIIVIPPNGSKIRYFSNESVDIKINGSLETIGYLETVSIFSPINFCSSIDGLDEYSIRISYTDFKKNHTKDNITEYIIDWGNNNISKGNGTPPQILINKYNKEGTYQINIKITDKNGMVYTYKWDQTFELAPTTYVKLWTYENKETVAAGSAGTVSILAIIGIILTETGKYKLLSLFLIAFPMYTRIHKEDVLDQFVRGKIYGFIKGNPGVHYNQIMKDLDMKNGTLSYHMYMLEKTGMIKSRKEGLRYRAFYPTDMKFPQNERYRLTNIQLDILNLISKNSGISQKEISKKLNEKHQTISYNVKVLRQAGLINLNKKGRKTSCYKTEDIDVNII
jgi:predicted transcriptional regulator